MRFLLLAALSLLPSIATAGDMWRAGAASVCLTPAEPMWLAGYPEDRQDKPFRRVALDVYAKVLALEDAAERRFVFVTLDLHGVTPWLRETVAKEVEQRFGIPSAALLLNASHTHCGPEIRDPLIARPALTGERVKRAAQFRAVTARKIVGAVGDALARMEAVTLRHGLGRAGFAMNRRPDFSLARDHPNFNARPNPWGPVDHDVPVLQAEAAASRRTIAILFGYACHNTTLNGDDLSAVYAGYAQRELESSYPGAVALFLMGCGGDQNPHPRRGQPLAEQHGRTLATAATGALTAARLTLAPQLRFGLTHVSLAYAAPPSRTELERRLRSREYFEANHARLLLEKLDRGEALPLEYPCPVQVVRFGDELVLVALGGETVVDYSLRLKREISQPKLWIAGYSNDVFTYVPSERILAEGGYEGARCMRYTETMGFHPGPWAPGLENKLVAAVHRLVGETAR